MMPLGTLFYLAGAVATFCLVRGMLNVSARHRTITAVVVALLWLPLLVIAIAFLAVDLIETAWRRHDRRQARIRARQLERLP